MDQIFLIELKIGFKRYFMQSGKVDIKYDLNLIYLKIDNNIF